MAKPTAHAAHTDPHDDDHGVPERTTPQGIQAYGVHHAHETLDARMRPVMMLVALLFVVTFGTIGLIIGVMRVYEKMTPSLTDAPSPHFLVQQVPPEPRLLPNRIDAELRPLEPHEGPVEYRLRQEKPVHEALEQLGLMDRESALPALPTALIEKAHPGSSTASAGITVLQPVPSETSGGTTTEDALR